MIGRSASTKAARRDTQRVGPASFDTSFAPTQKGQQRRDRQHRDGDDQPTSARPDGPQHAHLACLDEGDPIAAHREARASQPIAGEAIASRASILDLHPLAPISTTVLWRGSGPEAFGEIGTVLQVWHADTEQSGRAPSGPRDLLAKSGRYFADRYNAHSVKSTESDSRARAPTYIGPRIVLTQRLQSAIEKSVEQPFGTHNTGSEARRASPARGRCNRVPPAHRGNALSHGGPPQSSPLWCLRGPWIRDR